MGGAPSHEAQAEVGPSSLHFGESNQKEICLVPLTKKYFPNATCSAFEALYRTRCQDKVLLTFVNSEPGKVSYTPAQEIDKYWELLVPPVDSIIYDTNAQLRDAIRSNPKLLRPVPCVVLQLLPELHASSSAHDEGAVEEEGKVFEFGSRSARVIGFFNIRNTQPAGVGWLTGGVFANHQLGEAILLKALALSVEMYELQCRAAGIRLTADDSRRHALSDALPSREVAPTDHVYVSSFIQHEVWYEFVVTNYAMLRFTACEIRKLLHLIPRWEENVVVHTAGCKVFVEVKEPVVKRGIALVHALLGDTATPHPASSQSRTNEDYAAAAARPVVELKESDPLYATGKLFEEIHPFYIRAMNDAELHDPHWKVISPGLCLWELPEVTQERVKALLAKHRRVTAKEEVSVPLLGVVPHCVRPKKVTAGSTRIKEPERKWIVANAESCLGRPLTSGNSTSGKGFEFPTFSAFLNAAAEYASRTAPPNSDRWTSLSHRGGFYRLDSPPGVTATIQVRISQPWFLQLPEVKEQIERIESQIKEELTAWNALHADDDPVTQGAKEKQRIYFRSTDKNEEVSFELLVRYAGPNPLQDLHFEGPMCVPSRQVSTASFGSTNSSGAAAAAAVKSNSTQSLSSAASSQEPACTINTFHFAEDFFLELSKKEISTRQRFRNAPYKPE